MFAWRGVSISAKTTARIGVLFEAFEEAQETTQPTLRGSGPDLWRDQGARVPDLPPNPPNPRTRQKVTVKARG